MIVLVLFAIVLIGTNMIGTLLASPFGIGLILGVAGSLYLYPMYTRKQTNTKQHKSKS